MTEPLFRLLLSDRPFDLIFAEPASRTLRRRIAAEETVTSDTPEVAEFYRHFRARRNNALPQIDVSGGAALAGSLPEPEVDPQTPVWAVIIESRAHENLEFVVRQMVEILGVPVQLIHGRQNAEAVATRLSDLIAAGRVHPAELDDRDGINPARYNGLLLSPVFWERLIGRKRILFFQTDSLLCPRSDYGLRDFADLDYVGAAWRREVGSSVKFDGGNGGFSLRDWERSVACLGRFDPALWPSSEDKYFAFHIDLIGGRVATMREAARFASEHWFLYRSFGAHRLRSMLPTHLARFLRYCPEGERIADGAIPDRTPVRQLRAWLAVQVMRAALAL